MAARNRARYLAPIALAATIVATYLVVHDTVSKQTTTVHSQAVREPTSHSNQTKTPSKRAKFYTVQSGDTLSAISAKTGVSLPAIEQLNPGVNPGALQTGQRLRLRQ
jgi:LysM repeat protein